MNPFPTSSVGRKLMLAVTGQMMLIFIIVHAAGNFTIFLNKLNDYAAGLHMLPALLWAFRLVMLTVLGLHIFYAIQITLENNAARPQAYAVKHDRTATFAGKNMIWTGAIVGAFIIYHLLHFTFQVTDPSIAALANKDAMGRPDVLSMVVNSFRNPAIAAAYIVSVAALWLHLTHGIQSSFQTWGLNGERSFPIITRAGAAAAVILLLAYSSIPITIVTGLLNHK